MSALGLMNHYPFISALSPPFPINAGHAPLSTNIIPFATNTHSIPFSGLPFFNACDLATTMISPGPYTIANDFDISCGDKFFDENNISIRLLMTCKEVGSIIGKRGDNIKRYREESMARINISDGNSPERIVTIFGNCDQIYNAVGLICRKFEEDAAKVSDKLSDSNQSTLYVRLLILPDQYNAIIGNGAEKMAQLKETSDVTILFGIDFMPHSSERLLTISGSSESIAKCILELCKLLNEHQSNIYRITYSPKPMSFPGIPAPAGSHGPNKMSSPVLPDHIPVSAATLPILPMQNMCSQFFYPDQMPCPIGLPLSLIPLKIPSPIPTYHHKSHYETSPWRPINDSGSPPQHNFTRELFVENEMIGCIIGRGGSTINEIRALSGAQIKISNCEDGKQERKINIFGSFDSVQTAQLLINSRITWELFRWNY